MNAKTLRLLLMMLVCGIFTAHAQYSGGSGTAEDPFKISTLADLKELSLSKADLAAHFVLTNDIDATETNTWDDGAGVIVGFTPIGSDINNSFRGVFDGKGYSIDNLYINRPNTSKVGFFGFLGSSHVSPEVKNLTLQDATVTGSDVVGGLAGQAYGEIYNCHVSANVLATKTSYVIVGGLAGRLTGTAVLCSSAGTVEGYDYVGGLVGELTNNNDYTYGIFRSYSTADVTALKSSTCYAGGLVGKAAASISNSYATGNVTAANYVGGLTGYMSNNSKVIEYCFSRGTVTSGVGTCGGLVGYLASGSLNNCYTLSEVVTEATTYVGALIGRYPYTKNISDNYYNSDLGTTDIGAEDECKGISLANFSVEATFANWDFSADWEMTVLSDIAPESLPYPRGLSYDYLVSYDQILEKAGTVSGDYGWRNKGDEVTFIASEAITPYVFAGWYLEDEKVSDENVFTFNVSGDGVYTARYMAEYSGGSGTEEAPYIISSLDDLALLSQTPEYYGSYFILSNDIDASDTKNWVDAANSNIAGFTPIGQPSKDGTNFTGHFDGKGYTISNLFINSITEDNVALFGFANKATIVNLNMIGYNIIARDNVGALIGQSAGCIIDNCSVNGEVQGQSRVGGIAGYLSSGSISKSNSAGTLKSSGGFSGGLVGMSSYCVAEECFSSANVYGDETVGGLMGKCFGTTTYCYATGNVEGREFVGGFAGSINSEVGYCFATGDVSIISNIPDGLTHGYIGGFTGDLVITSTYKPVVYMCYATGAVTNSSKFGGFYGDFFSSNYSNPPTACVYDKETSTQADQEREGVTALTTAQFADINNFPEGWSVEWEIATLEEFDSNPRPYLKKLVGYDYQVHYEIENVLAGSISADQEEGWFHHGDEVTLTATTEPGYEFDGWYIGEDKVSEEAIFTATISETAIYVAKHSRPEVGFSGGNGSALNPYKIATLEDLNILANRIEDFRQNSFILINDIDASASAAMQNGLGFRPIGAKIGNQSVAFNGSIDGDGYAISNLTINNPDETNLGFFRTFSGSVSNLTFKDCNIIGEAYVGIIAGQNSGTITNCTVIGGSVTGETHVGGVTGDLPYSGKTYFSSVDGTVVIGTNKVGGFAGNNSGIVSSSSAKAIVTGSEEVGGFIGYLKGSIKRSSASSTVNGAYKVGGFIGSTTNGATIEKSYANSNVTVKDNGGENHGTVAGGFVGYLYYGTINDCYAVGSLTALDKAAGFAGFATNRLTVNNCYSAVAINAPGMFTAGFIAEISTADVTVTGSYFDTDISGYTEAYSSDASGIAEITALSSEEMSSQANFNTLDFETIWEVSTNEAIDNNARPYLKWESSSSEVSIKVVPEGVAKAYGAGWYSLGDEVELSVATETGWKVQDWRLLNVEQGTSNTLKYTIGNEEAYVFTVTLVEDFSAKGEGTAEMPYEITNLSELEQLTKLSSLWDKHFVLMNDIDASATKDWNVGDHDRDIQTPEIAMGYSPIGDTEDVGNRGRIPFSGTFDGQGYTISGLYVYRPNDAYIGLFGCIKGATIKNLTLEDADITGNGYSSALVGSSYLNKEKDELFISTIDNCNVIQSKISGGGYTAGIIGYAYYLNILNSSVQDVDLTSGPYSGGLVGDLLSDATVKNCYSTGSVTGYGDNVGGLVGRCYSRSSVMDSYSECTVLGTQYVGGLVGYQGAFALIKDCYATGATESRSLNGCVGGFVGGINIATISDCMASGDVTSLDLYAGGFLGYSDGASNTIIEKCYATGNVYGRRFLGGFAGICQATISYSYSTGTVDGSVEEGYEHSEMDVQFGGFTARNGYNCNITNCFTLSDVTGYILVGGFVGVNAGYIGNCYSANVITAKGQNPGAFIAHVMEDERSKVVGSYYDKTIAGISPAIGSGKIEGVVGIETKDFADITLMPELDFSSTWKIKVNEDYDDNSRPYLKWEDGGSKLDIAESHLYAGEYEGNGWYTNGESVSLFAQNIQPGFAFSHWELNDVLVSEANPYEFDFSGDEDMVYTAVYKEDNILTNGDGSESNPYIISTLKELVCLTNIPSIWNKYFELGADIDASASTDLNQNTGLSPIGGDYENRFTGQFNGKGYTISGLFVNRASSQNAQALFAHVGDEQGAVTVIKNINLNNVLVAGANGVGALVGDMTNTQVSNCSANGLVLGTSNYIGGLVGRSNGDSHIYSSSYKGTVFTVSSITGSSTGGLVGYSGNTLVERCYAITDSVSSTGESVGGLIGYNHDVAYGAEESDEQKYGIKQCFAVSNLVAATGDYVGGLVGANKGAYIKESYVVATMESRNDKAFYVAGLIGSSIRGTVIDTYFNKSKPGVKINSYGKDYSTQEFENTSLFNNWKFDVEGGWKMAVGLNGDLMPCFSDMDTYTLTFKAGEFGKVAREGSSNKVDEITDVILKGFHSRKVTAIADIDHEFVNWQVEGAGIWDMDNETTYVPGDKGTDMVLVANFNPSEVGVNQVDGLRVSAYPNPVKDVVYFNGVNIDSSIKFVDVRGNVVLIENNFNGQSINISHLNAGVYVAIIQAANGTQKVKVVKQ
ncbi:GLUG motif-containing protein [Saccharicrinis aurantiacus]|uniref:GLUG motif-containing protein n=1 Tax=Saccharicrinis aurantiacus TaxID=1849719 RepID=UPI00249180D4|nr:GLUG motif-containing protein [Saccharicrinis aurantiacus]